MQRYTGAVRSRDLIEMHDESTNRDGLELLRADGVGPVLLDESFRTEWSLLLQNCPWATASQAPEFVAIWYQIYGKLYEPILIVSRSLEGRLNGMLALARARQGGELVPAGGHQAEYQVWLCDAELAESFPRRAFALVRKRFPTSSLKLSYIPAGTPLGWLDMPRERCLTLLKSSRRPLLNVATPRDGSDALRKPGNKSRLRQLRKLGSVQFRRVTDPAEFAPLLKQVVQFHDHRQSVSHGSTPFQNDPLKESFYFALMHASELAHVTVLEVGDRVASAHVNMIQRDEVQLCLIAHNPALERLSPGKLHIHFLAKLLAEEGYQRLDLTPGGEEYKDRFANGADTVHSLTLFTSPMHRDVGAGITAVADRARSLLTLLHIKPARVAALAHKAHKVRLTGTADALRNLAGACFFGRDDQEDVLTAQRGSGTLKKLTINSK